MLYDFVRRLDKKKDGKIDFEEFSAALDPHFNNAVSKDDLPWIRVEMKKLAKVIGSSQGLRDAYKEHANKKSPDIMNYKAFSKYLTELYRNRSAAAAVPPVPSSAGDGTVSVEAPALDPLIEYSEHQKRKLFSFLDITESDSVYFEDFESAVFGTDFLQTKAVREAGDILTEEIWSLLYRRRYMLRDLFRRVDEDASGTVDAMEFKAAVEAFNETVESRLTPQQINVLLNTVKKGEDGGIDYEAFLSSIHVVDTDAEEEEEEAFIGDDKTADDDGAVNPDSDVFT